MGETSIQWCQGDDGSAGKTWNPVRGCSRVSPGCGGSDGGGCYAERQAHRFAGPGGPYEGLTRATAHGPRWTGEVRLVPDMLDAPLRWTKPRRVFVNSMSDLFHEKLTNEEIAAVFGVMAAAPWHTFQILTKRAEHMREWFAWAGRLTLDDLQRFAYEAMNSRDDRLLGTNLRFPARGITWPLPNCWIGVSCEDQARADARIPHLLATPAAVRFVSAEPLLGPIDLTMLNDGSWYDREGAQLYNALSGTAYYRNGEHGLGGGPRLDLVICGGESGPRARPCDVAWIRGVVRQCGKAGVACFVKQAGANFVVGGRPVTLHDPKGGDLNELPIDLRVRQMPAGNAPC